jgi:hypothetical protein
MTNAVSSDAPVNRMAHLQKRPPKKRSELTNQVSGAVANGDTQGKQRTALRSRLSSRASLFVPGKCPPAGQAAVPPALASMARESAKVPVRCVIEGAFGNRLCSVNMADLPAHTEVQVVVQAKPNEMCNPWAVEPQAQTRALHVLLQAFKTLGDKVKALEPSADASQLQVKYSEASSENLCWQFGQYGYCPRPSCRWEHAPVETFIVAILVQPAAINMSSVAMSPQTLPNGMVGYIVAAPMPPTMDQCPGMVYAVPMGCAPMNHAPTLAEIMRCDSGQPLVDGTCQRWPVPELTSEGCLSPVTSTPTGSPKLRPADRARWADIDEDEC